MAVYFFDFSDTGDEFPDTEGTELPNLDAVKDEAIRALVEVVKEVLPDGSFRELACKVRDENGRQLLQAEIRFQLQTLE